MYSNEGAVDPTAVKMSQMVGVFLTGLGLASLTMRPAELNESDLLSIRDEIGSSIAGLKSSIINVNTSVDRTSTEVHALTGVLQGFDLRAVTDATDAVVAISRDLQAGVANVQDLVEGLDLSVDVDLGPVIDRIMNTHSTEMQRMLDIINRLDDFETAQDGKADSVREDLISELASVRASLVEQVSDLVDFIEALDVDVDLTPVLNATAEVKTITGQHSANFDSFIRALAG